MKSQCIKLCLCLVAPLVGHAQSLPSEQPPKLVASATPKLGRDMEPLQRLVKVALERSPGSREAQANWRASLQDVEQSKAALWPRLDVNANTGATKLDGGGAPALTGGVGATASYTLLDFGKTRDQIDARQFQAASLQARVLLARESTTFETVNAYLQLVKYQRLIHIYEEHIVDLNDLVNKLSEIVVVFAGRASELTQAKTRLGQAHDALNSMKAKRREFQLSLMRQTGDGQAGDLVGDVVPVFPVDAVKSVLAQASINHPAVLSAKAEADSAKAQAAEARDARDPQVELQLAKQTGRDSLGRSYPMQLYVSAKWAAFQGFGDKAAEQALLERAAAASERVAQFQIELEFNVNSAWADYEAQTTRIGELRNLVRGTDQVRQDYYVQWRDLGKRSLLDVLSAESEHLSTRLNLAGSEVDQSIALARMKYEAGQLKEWLVGDDGKAVAFDDPAGEPPVLAKASEAPKGNSEAALRPAAITVQAMAVQPGVFLAPAQIGAIESDDVPRDGEEDMARQLAQAQ
jgi:adhesin transport system outer membrane protein